MWNCLFGVLMMFLQWKWDKWITTRFGFLNGWFGWHVLPLTGSNIMVQYEGCVFCWLSWIVRRARQTPCHPVARAAHSPAPRPRRSPARKNLPEAATRRRRAPRPRQIGGFCIFIGVMDIIFGCKCAKDDQANAGGDAQAAGGGAQAGGGAAAAAAAAAAADSPRSSAAAEEEEACRARRSRRSRST